MRHDIHQTESKQSFKDLHYLNVTVMVTMMILKILVFVHIMSVEFSSFFVVTSAILDLR